MPDELLPNNQHISVKDMLKAQYAQNYERFIIFANVLVPPFSSSGRWHQLSKDGWTVIPTSDGREYFKEFEVANTNPKDWVTSIDSLNRLLLAYFISDFSPRKIYNFELPGHILEKSPNLLVVFGLNRKLSIEDNATLASEMSGTLFNGLVHNDPNSEPDISLIYEWYDVFEDKVLFNCVNLVKESFILINRQFGYGGFYNYVDLAMGIMLLVSALEGLFTNGQENTGDIKFKFKIVGSLYYQKNVTAEFLKKIDDSVHNEKFTESQFRQILSILYDLRSDVAHGSYAKILKGKNWKTLLSLLKVYYDDSFDQAVLSKHVAMALGLLQKHLLALIIQSKADLSKGISIIDEIKI
jgi:Apea-like HEPN